MYVTNMPGFHLLSPGFFGASAIFFTCARGFFLGWFSWHSPNLSFFFDLQGVIYLSGGVLCFRSALYKQHQ